MEVRERNNYLAQKYKKNNPSCQICGCKLGVVIHHKVPFSIGGEDSFDNYISLCNECHKNQHRKDISVLTKNGIEKARNERRCPLVSIDELYGRIFLMTLYEDRIGAEEIMGAIHELSVIKTVSLDRIKKQKTLEVIKRVDKILEESED